VLDSVSAFCSVGTGDGADAATPGDIKINGEDAGAAPSDSEDGELEGE
jgi:hypothetical protein